ncbi:MAG: PspC domain-containing protein [Kouleothrix sp.]
MQGKRFLRSRNDRVIAGIAGGIAAMLNIDPLLVRLGFLVLALFNGLGLLAYIALWLLVPNEDSVTVDSRRPDARECRRDAGNCRAVQRVRLMFRLESRSHSGHSAGLRTRRAFVSYRSVVAGRHCRPHRLCFCGLPPPIFLLVLQGRVRMAHTLLEIILSSYAGLPYY